ncbi:MAG: radical SAM protein, partial [Nanoarchaeota archaeon]
VAHDSIVKIIRALKASPPHHKIPIAILENTQAVTAYSLQTVADTFFKESVDYVLAGEPELRTETLLHALAETDKKKRQHLLAAVDGLIYFDSSGKILHNEKKDVIQNPDILPFPAWDLFTLDNYWKLAYAHAPLTTKKYLPLLTSRGCPYPCTFCVVPDTNNQRWRPRSAQNVVDEIEFFSKKYGVAEFHLEDLNPTIKKERMVAISQEILRRNLSVTWKIASGTKVETLDEETIGWMAKAGCSYISISPESGSERIMKLMKKPFPYDRALELVRAMRQNNITTQACFILGYPGERKEDITLTNKYIRQIVKAGIDEIAVLILTPTPGSVIFQDYAKENNLDDISKLTFTPTWRKDYKKYALERFRSYMIFIFWRVVYHPLSVIKQPFSFLHKHFYT